MKKPSQRTLIIVGICIVVVAGGIWLWRGKTPRSAVATPTATDSLAPLASVSPLAIAYDAAPSDWKTYASASLGFSVLYPPDWKVASCGSGCVGWAPTTAESGQLALGVVKSTGTIANVLTEAKPYLAGQETVKIGTLSWLKLTLQQPTTGDVVTSHFIARGTSLYEFGTATSDTALLAIYGKMLASFKFLK